MPASAKVATGSREGIRDHYRSIHTPKAKVILQYQSSRRYAGYQSRALQIGNTPTKSFDCEAKIISNVPM